MIPNHNICEGGADKCSGRSTSRFQAGRESFRKAEFSKAGCGLQRETNSPLVETLGICPRSGSKALLEEVRLNEDRRPAEGLSVRQERENFDLGCSGGGNHGCWAVRKKQHTCVGHTSRPHAAPTSPCHRKNSC